MGPGAILRARSAIEQAPAVWELEGPIIFGPSTSKTLIKAMRGSFLKISVISGVFYLLFPG